MNVPLVFADTSEGEVVGLVDSGRLFVDLIESSESAMALGKRWGVIVAYVTYILYFAKELIDGVRSNQRKKLFTEEFKAKQEQSRHICAFCGATEKSNPELSFRYCSQTGKCYGGCSKCENSSDRK